MKYEIDKIANRIADVVASYAMFVLIYLSLILLFIQPIAAILCLIAAVAYHLSANNTLEIKIKYFDLSLPTVNKIHIGDWVDLRAAERVELKAGEYKLIPLGVGMILPKSYEAHVLPRSSTPSKFGILMGNSMGVIDNSYSGDNDEWKFPAVAIRDTVIEKGERICQFRIVKNQPRVKFTTVFRLNDVSRGGIGSTGTK